MKLSFAKVVNAWLTNKIDKSKRKFVEVIVVLTKICRLKIVKKFRDIEVFATLEDAKLLLTIKDIKFSIMCEDIDFLIALTNSIFEEKLFSFIIRQCVS